MVDLSHVFITFSFEKERSALGTAVTGNTVNKMHMQLPGAEPRTESHNYSLILVNLIWILKQRFPC